MEVRDKTTAQLVIAHLDEEVRAALAKDPARRPQSAGVYASLLRGAPRPSS